MGAFLSFLNRLGFASPQAKELREERKQEMRQYANILEKQQELCRIREWLDQAYVPSTPSWRPPTNVNRLYGNSATQDGMHLDTRFQTCDCDCGKRK